MSHFRSHTELIAILAAAGVLYLSGLGSHGMFMWDEAHYAVLGRALAEGKGYVGPDGEPESLRPPMLPAAIATVLTLAPSADDTTVRRVTVVFALLCIFVVYGCVYIEAGSLAAIAAALLFATFPEIWRSTSYLLSELPFMLFYTPAVFFFHRGLHSDSRNFLVAWPCFALALLTRYTAVLFGPTCVMLVGLALLTRDREALARMRAPAFVLGPAVAAIILAPLFARAWIHFGDPLVGFKAASRQLPDYSAHAQMPLFHYLALLPTMMGRLPAAAALLAIGGSSGRRNKLGISCTIAATVIVAWLSQYGWKEPRLISAALPFLAIVIALGIDSTWTSLNSGESAIARRMTTPVIGVSVLVVAVGAIRFDPSYGGARFDISMLKTLGYPSFLEATEWISTRTPESARLLGPNCYQISWYSRRSCRLLPSQRYLDDNDRTLAEVAAHFDYVVATSFERGQPAYLNEAIRAAEQSTSADVQTFSDRRYWTKIVATEVLRTSAPSLGDAPSERR